ncbi:hypothetical protein [Shewanella sp. W3-18-1]|uniref:hypothetical protein n=1 Tax=Shewanella sp. (strain W3-18-1) TaxID=351745 RepID=UPI00059E9B85|nr:hypothetical protein [Shewanella sp. W3-18-1]
MREDDGKGENYALSVIPAKAGIHSKVFCYLKYKANYLTADPRVREDDDEGENYALSVIPAKAGIHSKVFYYLEYKVRT